MQEPTAVDRHEAQESAPPTPNGDRLEQSVERGVNKRSAIERAAELLDRSNRDRRAQVVANHYYGLQEQVTRDMATFSAGKFEADEPVRTNAQATKDNPNRWLIDDLHGAWPPSDDEETLETDRYGHRYVTWEQRIGEAVDGMEALKAEHKDIWRDVDKTIDALAEASTKRERARIEKYGEGEDEDEGAAR